MTAPTVAAAKAGSDGGDLLVARNTSKQFGGLLAVSKVDFTIPQGAIASLIGPNGAGKTTFFNIIAGLYKPTSGTIMFRATQIEGRRPDEIVGLGVARTFQNIRLFANMTALENVMVGRHVRMRANPFEAMLRTPRERREEAAVRARSAELLEFVGLGGSAREFAKNLPYGDQRRLEIARALASHPTLLVLDEPAAGMNHVEAERLSALIRSLAADGVAVLIIEHNVRMMLALCDRITVLNFGEVIAAGTPEEVAAVPESHTGHFLSELVKPAARKATARKRGSTRKKVAAAA